MKFFNLLGLIDCLFVCLLSPLFTLKFDKKELPFFWRENVEEKFKTRNWRVETLWNTIFKIWITSHEKNWQKDISEFHWGFKYFGFIELQNSKSRERDLWLKEAIFRKGIPLYFLVNLKSFFKKLKKILKLERRKKSGENWENLKSPAQSEKFGT